MASLHAFSLLVIFMTSFALVIQTGLSAESNYAPEPSPSYIKYIKSCAARLNAACGREIFNSVFYGNQTVGDECCLDLVNDMGQRCHEDLTNFLLMSPQLKAKKIPITQRSKKVWGYCASLSHNLSPMGSAESNYAPEPSPSYVKYIKSCAARLNPTCGREIFNSVFYGNQTVGDECCLDLVNDMGQCCHEDLTNFLLMSPQLKAKNIPISQRSKKVWGYCASLSHNLSPTEFARVPA
ncbi:uncharacterized protein LOC130744873 [Lotus japonicus]|uniref:uncharacterized protein LOC130744871 n=1 Tax=Lotus japonicus TaxID=34305 RepID=UPI0025826D1A|nr:uncharacterized protein LOC130744871 [Lotus japonicus]XP_057453016.1 uncharacterized protein LOC130744873 [Lotus japonicus]